MKMAMSSHWSLPLLNDLLRVQSGDCFITGPSSWGINMSNGGLLEKAAKQQTGDANLGVPPNTVTHPTTDEGGSNSTTRLLGLIFGGWLSHISS